MNKQILKDTIAQLFAKKKGLLAMDGSTRTCNKQFSEIIIINHQIPRGTAGHFIKVVFEMRRFIIE